MWRSTRTVELVKATQDFFFGSALVHSFGDVLCKVFNQEPACAPLSERQRYPIWGTSWIHSGQFLKTVEQVVENPGQSGSITDADGASDVKKKRKKLKNKSINKNVVEALKKIKPNESSETTHDPEILTPEEHFYFLKMRLKSKNYVPVGRRGIYQGVILNMHLHWKKHQTLKVVVKTFSSEVKEIAAELARLSGEIVLDIQEDNTIIMYRGKNYSQPPTEIMSPRITLSRKNALDKSKYRDGLRAVRKYIPRLEQDLELLRAKAETQRMVTEEAVSTDVDDKSGSISDPQLENSDRLRALIAENNECPEESNTESGLSMGSDSEELSDIFETDSGTENEKTERPLYLDGFEKFPAQSDKDAEDFEEHPRQVSADSRKAKLLEKDKELLDLDEVDQMFLKAASLLKKRRGKR
ncbi:hypothetical protein NMG60_11014332 [Bertholletia excelsa]